MLKDQIANQDKDECSQDIVEKTSIALLFAVHCFVYLQLLAISVKEQFLLALYELFHLCYIFATILLFFYRYCCSSLSILKSLLSLRVLTLFYSIF